MSRVRWSRCGSEWIGRTVSGPWLRVAPSPAGEWLVQRGASGALDAAQYTTVATASTLRAAKARAEAAQ